MSLGNTDDTVSDQKNEDLAENSADNDTSEKEVVYTIALNNKDADAQATKAAKKEASKRRNNACHGGTKVSRKEAIEDKQWVLPKSEAAKESQNCKKLILEILSLYDLE